MLRRPPITTPSTLLEPCYSDFNAKPATEDNWVLCCLTCSIGGMVLDETVWFATYELIFGLVPSYRLPEGAENAFVIGGYSSRDKKR